MSASRTSAHVSSHDGTACVARRYPLPPQSIVAVSLGAKIAPGDILAHVTRPPLIVPIAAELGAVHPNEVMTIVPAVGTPVRAGDQLARVRRGLRMHHVEAPVDGNIATQHPSGVVTLAPAGDVVEIRARYAGTVTVSDATGIVVATSAVRIPVAFGMNTASSSGRLVVTEPLLTGVLTTRTSLTPSPADAALVVAHVADMKALAHASQSGGALLIIGSVTEAVAWELNTHANDTYSTDTLGTLVLGGPGDAEEGAQAVTPLRSQNGASVIFDGETHSLLVLDERGNVSLDPTASSDEHGIVFHTPAAWREPGTMTGPVHEHALDMGLRILATETTSARRGTTTTPIQNFGKSA
jgi:hypothetical protein